jgi:hypothetical protein
MRTLCKLLSSFLVIFVLASISVSQTSCSKTVTNHDTTIKTVHDTTVKIVKDTIVDTLYNLNYGLVAYYNFNNGNLNDSSGRGNNILFNNATVTSDRFGRAGNAYRFTGGAYMRVPNSSTLSQTQITLMAIVRVNAFYTGQYWANEIMMKGYQDQQNGVYGLRVQPVSFDYTKPLDTTREMFSGVYGNYNNASIMDSSFLVHGGDWNTVVYTYDGFVAKLYVNGRLDNTRTAPFGFNPTTNDLYIGKTENTTFPYYFDGAIDEIRIYSKVLSPFLVAKLSTLTE